MKSPKFSHLIHPCITLLILLLISQVAYSSDEAFKQSAINADQRIDAFDQALKGGDPKIIRETALALQKDPIAVKRVNNQRSDAFKTQLNNELGSIQTETKAKVRKRIAEHYGVPESDVTFFEATNPSTEVKVGQDWDVTARVQGIDVPLDVAAPVIQESFYESAKGHKPASLEEAARYAHAQAVEPINYKAGEAYGLGGRKTIVDPKTGKASTISEGGHIIVGDKAEPLRDPRQLTEVMAHKSDLAKNNAADIREAAETKIKEEGLTGEAADKVRAQAEADAQAGDMEQARQHTKQQSRQMDTRVEARGGEVHEQVRKGNAILDDVASNKISPEEGRRRLAAMGETPESIIAKGSGLHEAAQVLGETPQEVIERGLARKAAGSEDVFTQNTKDQMKLKDLERRANLKREGFSDAQIEAKMQKSKSTLEEIRARAKANDMNGAGQSTKIESELEVGKGKSSFAEPDLPTRSRIGEIDFKQKFGDAMDVGEAAGIIADGIRQESEAAALEGREFSAANALKNAGYGMGGGNQYDLSHSISQQEIERAEAAGEGREMAILRSLYENAKQRLEGAYTSSAKINKEAGEAEVERASEAGEEASALRAKLNAAGTILTNMSGATQVFDAVTYDSDADRQMAETGRNLQEKAEAKLEAGLIRTGELEQQINDLAENWDLEDPAIKEEFERLKEEHAREREALQADLTRLKENPSINRDSPTFRVLSDTTDFISKDPAAEAIEYSSLRADVRTAIAECNFDQAYGPLELIPVHQGRPELESALQAAVMRENKTTDLFEAAKKEADYQNPHQALVYLQQASSNTQCEASRAKIQGIIASVQTEVEASEVPEESIEALANLDCSAFGNAASIWNKNQGKAQCICNKGYEFNSSGTACRRSRDSLMNAASCDQIKGSYKKWDSAKETVMCQCPSGYTISNGACVKKQVRTRTNNGMSNQQRQQMFGQLANSLMQLQQKTKGPSYSHQNANDFLNQAMQNPNFRNHHTTQSVFGSSGNTYAPSGITTNASRAAGFGGGNISGKIPMPAANTAKPTGNCKITAITGMGRPNRTTCGWLASNGQYYDSYGEANGFSA